MTSGSGGLAASNTRLYRLNDRPDPPEVEVYHLGTAVNFGGYVPYQFDSADGDTIFFYVQPITPKATLSPVQRLDRIKVYKLDKSTKAHGPNY